MFNYLKNILRADSPESSKRLIAVFATIQIFFVVVIVLFFIYFKIVESIYINTILYVLGGLAGLNVTLSATQSIMYNKNKTESNQPTYTQPNYNEPTYTSVNYDNDGRFHPDFNTQETEPKK